MTAEGSAQFGRGLEGRFFGAELLDNLAYATLNVIEALIGLCTCGYYFPEWTTKLQWKVQDLLMREKP